MLWSTWWPVSSSRGQRVAPPAASGSICGEHSMSRLQALFCIVCGSGQHAWGAVCGGHGRPPKFCKYSCTGCMKGDPRGCCHPDGSTNGLPLAAGCHANTRRHSCEHRCRAGAAAPAVRHEELPSCRAHVMPHRWVAIRSTEPFACCYAGQQPCSNLWSAMFVSASQHL